MQIGDAVEYSHTPLKGLITWRYPCFSGLRPRQRGREAADPTISNPPHVT